MRESLPHTKQNTPFYMCCQLKTTHSSSRHYSDGFQAKHKEGTHPFPPFAIRGPQLLDLGKNVDRVER